MAAILLVVLVNSGFVKSFFSAGGFIEFDVTSISIFALLPVLLIMTFKASFRNHQILIIFIFISFLIAYTLSAFYTTSESYYIYKLLALIGIIFCFVIGLFSDRLVIYLFFYLYSIFSLLAVVLYFTLIFSGLSPKAFNDFAGNSLVVGEMLGATAVIIYFSNLNFKYLLIALSFVIMIALGARGPILFSLLVIALAVFSTFRKVDFKTPLKIIIAITFLLFFIFISDSGLSLAMKTSFQDGLSRFALLFNEDKGDSVNSRVYMISNALIHINDNIFFGTGVGSFGIEVYGQDFRAYPHNVLLEIWFESGIIPVLLFLLLFLWLLVYLFKHDEHLIFYLMIYLFLNINKSSSLEEARLFFLLTGFSVSVIKFNKFKRSDNV
jgi:O-antigen ligase